MQALLHGPLYAQPVPRSCTAGLSKLDGGSCQLSGSPPLPSEASSSKSFSCVASLATRRLGSSHGAHRSLTDWPQSAVANTMANTRTLYHIEMSYKVNVLALSCFDSCGGCGASLSLATAPDATRAATPDQVFLDEREIDGQVMKVGKPKGRGLWTPRYIGISTG